MSDNNKFSLRVGYIQLNIIKHALQYYIKRPASKKEIEQEKKLLHKVKKEIGLTKQKYGITSKLTSKEDKSCLKVKR